MKRGARSKRIAYVRRVPPTRRVKLAAVTFVAIGIAFVHERTSHAVPDAGPRPALTKEQKAEREALLARATEAMTEGDLATALAASRRAHTMEPSAELRKRVVVMLLQLIEGFEKEGRLTQALEALEYETAEGALAGSEPDPKIQTRLEDLRKRTPTVIVEAPKGSRLRVDGFPRPVDGKPLRVDPGEHRFTVIVNGSSYEEKASLEAGEQSRVVRFALEAPAAPSAASEQDAARPAAEPPIGGERERPRPASCSCDIPGLNR